MTHSSDKAFLKLGKYKLKSPLNFFPQQVPKYLTIAIICAVIIRLICVPNRSSDYTSFLVPWYDFIVNNGGFSALKHGFADYTPPYLYWLVIASTLLSGLPKILTIKLFAMAVDFVCAFFTYKIVKIKYPEGKQASWAFLTVILSPVVIYNSAIWGQCDSIYTAGLIGCIYFLCIQKQIPALVSFGIGLSFKLQAMFLAPLLLIMVLKKRIRWYYLPIVPLVYLLAMLPAWLAGRPMLELLLVYFNQANIYKELAKGIPNLYQWIPNEYYNIVAPLGVIITTLVIFLLAFIVAKSKLEINHDRLIHLATISVLLVPYILPKMHQRYFYPADICSIILAFYLPQYRWVAIVVQLASLFSYLGTPSHIKFFSIILGFALCFVIRKSDLIYPKLNAERS